MNHQIRIFVPGGPTPGEEGFHGRKVPDADREVFGGLHASLVEERSCLFRLLPLLP